MPECKETEEDYEDELLFNEKEATWYLNQFYDETGRFIINPAPNEKRSNK